MEQNKAKILKNSCSSWLSNIESLKREYEDYVKNNKLSSYLKTKKDSYLKRGYVETEDEFKQMISKQLNKMVNFDFGSIEDRPLFMIAKNGTAARHQIDNCYLTLNDVMKHNLNDNKFYIYERVVYDYVKPYFDIDFKVDEVESIEDIKETLDFVYGIIDDFKNVNPDVKVVGLAEYKQNIFENDDDLIDLVKSYDGIRLFKNELDEFKKLLSIHIYINGICFKTSCLKPYIKEWLDLHKKYHNDQLPIGFDLSVYQNETGKQQIFRVPYSGKFDELKPRKANPEIINFMNDNTEAKKFIINHCIICADKNDLLINYEEEKPVKENKKKQQKANKVSDDEEDEQHENNETTNEDISIFKFITIDDKFQDSKILKDVDHFTFGQKLNWFISGLPLTEDEFIDEILLINPELNIEKFKLKFNYIQDFKCLYKLEHIKFKINCAIEHYLNQEKKNKANKVSEDEDVDVDEDIRTILKESDLETLFYINNKLSQYIDKYQKNNFITHEFYDFKELKRDSKNKVIPKKTKILYNCFKTIDEDTIYFIKDNEIQRYKNKEAMKKDLKLSGDSVNTIYDSLTCFENLNEFEIMRLNDKYEKLTDSEKCVDDLIDMIKQTFSEEDDFKYYISWLANKITYKTTNYRSIISQNENESAYDALKTYITQILSWFIDVKNADIRNLNKSLNGSYLTGHLTVIEEMPKVIKEIDAFINTLKMYTQQSTLDIEEKKEKPRKIKNRMDFIINTNHDVSKMFYIKADAEALSKRFRILTRKTIDVKKFSDVLDKYNKEDKDHLNAFCFYMYLKDNNDLIKYYKEHMKDKSKIEQLYISASTNDTMDKLDIDKTENDFIEWFKLEFIDKNKRLKLKSFTDYLKRNNIFKDIKQATLKQQLLTSKCLHVDKKENKLTDEEIKNIYAKYFNYVETINEDEY